MIRSRQAKLNARIARVAILVAKSRNDSDYAKYVKFRNLYRMYKAKLLKKYSSKAASIVRRTMK
jgi:hypothetical protein